MTGWRDKGMEGCWRPRERSGRERHGGHHPPTINHQLLTAYASLLLPPPRPSSLGLAMAGERRGEDEVEEGS